jgi:hypothetical protein
MHTILILLFILNIAASMHSVFIKYSANICVPYSRSFIKLFCSKAAESDGSVVSRIVASYTTHKSRVRLQRIERILSNRGVGSRREVSLLFSQGRVTVSGKVIRSGADKVPTNTTIYVDGQPLVEVYVSKFGRINFMV